MRQNASSMSGMDAAAAASFEPQKEASKASQCERNSSTVNVFPLLKPMSSASFAAAMQLGQNQSPWGTSSMGGDRQYMWYLRIEGGAGRG